MIRLDLTDEEHEVLIELVRDAIEADRYRLSPRVRRLRQILDKVEQSRPVPEPTSSTGPTRRRR